MAETNILSVSLKLYKQEIESLKSSLDKLEKTSKEYEVIANEVKERLKALNDILNNTTSQAKNAANSITDMKQKLNDLKAEASNMDVGSSRFKELSNLILETTSSLKELEENLGTFNLNVLENVQSSESLKSLLKALLQLMAEMLMNGIEPTDEAFLALAKRAGDMKDAMLDSQAVIRHYADDTKTLSTVVDIAKTGAAAYGTFKGALTLFGIENENVNESLQTMVTITTTLNSLQLLQTALVDRASITYRAYHGVVDLAGKALAFLGLTSKNNVATIGAETVATTAHTGAMVADTAATGAATVATQLFRKALIATGIGAIIVAIGTLISYLDDLADVFKSVGKWILKATGLMKEQTTAEKIAAAQAKKHKEELDALAKKEKELAEEGILVKATFEKLQAIWENTKSLEDRRKFVEQYKNEMNSLGVEINNVNDAERFFSKEGTEAFAKAIEIRAKLALEQEKLMRVIQKIDKAYAENWMGDAIMRLESQRDAIKDEIVKLSQELSGLTPKSSGSSTTKTKTTKSGSSSKKDEEDISGNIELLERFLEKQESIYQYQYDLLKALNKARLEDEIETENKIYLLKLDITQKEIDDRTKMLENEKITAEQRKQIEELLYDYREELRLLNLEHDIKAEELRVKLAKETLDNIYKQEAIGADAVTGLFEMTSASRLKYWVDKIKSFEPEVAKAYIETLAPEDVQQEVLDIYDAYRQENADKIMEWELKEEEQAYLHSLSMIEISKETLVQIGIDFGQDSELYLEQLALIYAQEEEAYSKHMDNMAKIQSKHSKATKKANKMNLDNYLQMGSGIADLMDNVAGIMEEDIRNKQESGKISEEEAKKQFETVKTLQLVSATVNMIQGAITAYTTAQSLGPIAGPIVGGINAAAVTAMGIMNIQKIKAQQWGSSSESGANTPAAATREATNVDFTGVSVNPLLDENADLNRMTTLSETRQTDQRVYILQSDIADSQRLVEVRQSQTTF